MAHGMGSPTERPLAEWKEKKNLSVWISIDKALVFAGFASISIPKGLAHTVSDKAGQNPFAHSFILPSANNFGTSGFALIAVPTHVIWSERKQFQ